MYDFLENGSLLSDLNLARLLEATESLASSRFVEARQKTNPRRNACWANIAGARVMFDGADSPLTQSFELGIHKIPTDDEWEQLETFLTGRGAPVFHEVSPMVPMEMATMLGNRGYRPIEWTNVMYRSLNTLLPARKEGSAEFDIEVVSGGGFDAWADLSAEGWNVDPQTNAFLRAFGQVAARTVGNYALTAKLAGKPVATGSLFLDGQVCLLAGASTIPEARNRGAQSALFQARMQLAAEMGAMLAMMCAQPGTPSQRNAQRNGFHIAYTRTKWHLIPATG
jgi:hypothetical protein